MKKKLFELEEETVENDLDFKNQIWANQLQERQIIINEEINSNIIEKAVIQIFNINEFDTNQEESILNYINLDLDIDFSKNFFKRNPIKIFINSSGGLLDEAFSLISAIESSVTPIYTIALGKAWSAAFLILLAGHQRFAQKYSSLMFHQGSAGIVGEFAKAFQYAEYWKNIQENVEKYVLEKTNIKEERLKEVFYHRQDWYIDPTEAIELGIIEDII